MFLACDQDAVEGRHIIAFTLHHVDERQLWSSKPRLATDIVTLLEEVPISHRTITTMANISQGGS